MTPAEKTNRVGWVEGRWGLSITLLFIFSLKIIRKYSATTYSWNLCYLLIIKKTFDTENTKGTTNPESTHGVYTSKTLSQETTFSNADFLPCSLSNIHLGSSTPVLLNKRTHRACGQPNGIRTDFVLRVDFKSNLDLVSKFSLVSHH
jgi:hypothetical protein